MHYRIGSTLRIWLWLVCSSHVKKRKYETEFNTTTLYLRNFEIPFDLKNVYNRRNEFKRLILLVSLEAIKMTQVGTIIQVKALFSIPCRKSKEKKSMFARATKTDLTLMMIALKSQRKGTFWPPPAKGQINC